jgi:hypothetical protein
MFAHLFQTICALKATQNQDTFLTIALHASNRRIRSILSIFNQDMEVDGLKHIWRKSTK